MTDFAAPLDDILFSMEAVAGAPRLPGYDPELARELLGHFAAFAEGEIAPLDPVGDRQGARLENGRVRMPEGFGTVYRAFAEQGWPGLTLPEAYGGQGLSDLYQVMTSEVFTGACHSLQMVTTLVPGAARTILAHGTEEQKARLLPDLASGARLATMALTEPGAGSDLGRIRTRAEREGDSWRITGEKIFISGGDQDMSDGILHLVLARTGGEGTRGLSLFACLSERADGTRNSVSVTRIEEKMGLHASPTCQLAFDGAEAELIGEEGRGLAAMFVMMNAARLDVSAQGVAHAARASHLARAYAAERVQGRGPEGAPATLDAHADVARMLDEIDIAALGSRALVHLAAVMLEEGNTPELVDFLTPVAKVHCSAAGMRAAELGMQVLGGYGYLGEYRLEQTYRDARICAIYEGASGIHAMTLSGHLLRRNDGAAHRAFRAFMASEVADGAGPAAESVLAAWDRAQAAVAASADPGPVAMDFLHLTADLAMQCLWARMDRNAGAASDPARIRRLAAKVAARAPLAVARAELLIAECPPPASESA